MEKITAHVDLCLFLNAFLSVSENYHICVDGGLIYLRTYAINCKWECGKKRGQQMKHFEASLLDRYLKCRDGLLRANF